MSSSRMPFKMFNLFFIHSRSVFALVTFHGVQSPIQDDEGNAFIAFPYLPTL